MRRNGKALVSMSKNKVAGPGGPGEKDARVVSKAIQRLVDEGLRFPRGGYSIRPGRGRVIVERLS